MRFNNILQLIFFASTTAALPGLSNAHEWKDKSGRYRVEAELVSANSELVVLRTKDHRLIALDTVHLSDEDQAFVRSKLEKSIKGSVAIGAGNPLVPIDGTAIPAEPLPTNVAETSPGATAFKPSVAERSASTVGGWRLIDGKRIQGEFMGFDLKPLSIKRASSEVYVGGVLFSQLDPVYKHILPMTIAHLENAKIDDVRDIEKWLIKSGPGPWTYKLEAVIIETPNRGSVAIPTFLLDKSVSDAIAVPLLRWREALASQVSEVDRNSYFDRERFMTRASMAAQVADADEAALSDVILLGTEEQVKLAAHAAREMVAGNSGNCGTNHGSSYRGTDHDPNLDAVENAGMAFVGTDVVLRGIADDGIHCVGGLGVNCYASCHEPRGVNSRIGHSHLRQQIMPSKQQPLWIEKHCETYHYSH